jgi:hypothetical protein
VPARQRAHRNWCPTLLASLLVAVSAAAAQQTTAPVPDLEAFESRSAADEPRAREQAIQVPSGGRPLTVTRLGDVPPSLGAAAERAQCRLTDELLARNPVLIFRPADGYRVMAVVTCQAITLYSRAFQFDRSVELEPSPMTFPLASPTGGISASQLPGLMSWDPETRTLMALRGQDHCPREVRHTYRQSGGELNGFALARIEHRQLRCATPEPDWLTLWQAPTWNLQQ